MEMKPVIAAFDFDGTLSYRDSLVSFLKYAFGPSRTIYNLFLVSPYIVRFLLGMMSRQETKEHVLTKFLAGRKRQDMQQIGQAFADKNLSKLVKPEGMQRLKWHLDQGHRCILVSANLDLYLHPWAKNQGFQDAIISICAVDKENCLTGRLMGANCWGPEKTRRLNELLGDRDKYILYAYGDSEGDKSLLEYADFGFYRTFTDK